MKISGSDALIVVDMQNDFCPGGALAVSEGDAIISDINALSQRFSHRVYTRDWHPTNHCSFSKEPKFVDESWPIHCVAHTNGAAFHPDLLIPDNALIVSKGSDPGREEYSGFDSTTLAETLRARGVNRVFICGLATDYCVKATALDALKSGFDTYVIEDLSRGVGPVEDAISAIKSAGVKICDSESFA